MELDGRTYSLAAHGHCLLAYFQELLSKSQLTDVTLQCEGVHVASCHRLVLAAMSQHFEAALATIFLCPQVTLDVDTKITGVSGVDMKHIIDFMYYGRIELAEGPASLLRAAHALGVSSLIQLLTHAKPGSMIIEARDHGRHLLAALNRLQMQKKFTDVSINCEGNHLASCHRQVLSAFSSHFEAALSATQNCTQVTLEIDSASTGVQTAEMQSILEFIYKGTLRLPRARITPVFNASRMLGVARLTEYMNAKAPEIGQRIKADINRNQADAANVKKAAATQHRIIKGSSNLRLAILGNRPQSASQQFNSAEWESEIDTHAAELSQSPGIFAPNAGAADDSLMVAVSSASVAVESVAVSAPCEPVYESPEAIVGRNLVVTSSNATIVAPVCLDPTSAVIDGYAPQAPPGMTSSADVNWAGIRGRRPGGASLVTILKSSESGRFAAPVLLAPQTASATPPPTGSLSSAFLCPPPSPAAISKRKRNASMLSLMSNGSIDDDLVLSSNSGTVKIRFNNRRNGASRHGDSGLRDKLSAGLHGGTAEDNEVVDSLYPMLADDGLLMNDNEHISSMSAEDNTNRIFFGSNEITACFADNINSRYAKPSIARFEQQKPASAASANGASKMDDIFSQVISAAATASRHASREASPKPSPSKKQRSPQKRRLDTKKSPLSKKKQKGKGKLGAKFKGKASSKKMKVKLGKNQSAAKKAASRHASPPQVTYTQPVRLEPMSLSAEDLAELNMPSVNRRSRQLGPTTSSSYQCELCGRCCKSAYSLKMHKETHNEEMLYECSLCSHIARTLVTLKAHVKLKHCVDLNGDKLAKNYVCTTCDATFLYSSQLDHHIRRKHLVERAFKCPYCDHRTTENSALQKHIRCIHTGDAPFKCNICKMAFKVQCNLVRHVRAHTGEKPYACSECNISYADKKNLDHHKLKHHGLEKQARYLHGKRVSRVSKVQSEGGVSEDDEDGEQDFDHLADDI